MTWGAYLHTTYISWKIVFKIRYTTYNTPNSFPFMEPLLEDISKENIANCASIPHKFYQRGPNVSHRGRTSTKRPRLFAGAFWRALDHRRHRGCIGGRSKRPPRGHNQRPRARMTTTKKGRQNGQKFHFYVTSIKKRLSSLWQMGMRLWREIVGRLWQMTIWPNLENKLKKFEYDSRLKADFELQTKCWTRHYGKFWWILINLDQLFFLDQAS